MKRAIGFNLGQRGDLILNTVALKAYKLQFPDSFFVFSIGPQYVDMVPLFVNHPLIDAIHVFDSYDGWPNKVDTEYLNRTKYTHVFNGMPNHTSWDWWKKHHQGQETILMHGINDSGDYKCELNKYFTVSNNSSFIAFAPFAGFYNKDNNKKLTIDFAQNIVNSLRKLGYQVLQVGGANEPILDDAIFCKSSYFESVRAVLGCRCLISTDTGMRWVASAYDFPAIGLDSSEHYGNRISAIQPINKNAIYLDSFNVNNISIDKILDAVKLI